MPRIESIDLPEHTWLQVLDLAARNWRSTRDEISWLVIAAAASAAASCEQEGSTDRQLVTRGALEGAAA